MADRATIRTGFPQEEFPGGRFTRAPDPRFGGNMARANEGAQYTGSPRYEHGAYLKGSPMHDAQYGNYVAPHRVDYTRNAPPQSSGTPNFRPPYGAPGQPSYGEWMQQIDPFHTGPYPPKKHPNPRMRGMGGGLESLESKIDLNDIFNRFPGMNLWKLIKQLDKRGIEYAGNDTGIGSTDEYQMAELTQGQKDMMGNPLNTPDFGVSKQDLWKKVKDMENKKWDLQWGVQEPTTQEEYDDYYNKLLQGEVGNWVT